MTETAASSSSAMGARALTHREIMTLMSGLLMGMFLAAIDQTIVATALPTIVGELGGLQNLPWVVTAYLLTSTTSTPLYGKISDLYGRRPVFQAAIVIFLVGSALCGLSQNLTQLIVFRGVQGLGGGGLIALSFVIVGDVLSPRQRGQYLGYFSAVFAVASVAGPLLGGLFTDHLSWRWIFYVNVPIGIVALIVTSRVLRLPRPERERPSLDILGAVLLAAAVVCLLLVAEWGGRRYDWGSPTIVGLCVAAAALLALFVAQEARADEPVLPLRLLRNRVVATCIVMAILSGAAMFGATIFLPLFLQAVSGVSATNSGLLLAPLMLAVTVSSIATGRSTTRTGRYKVFVVVGSALAFVAVLCMTTLDDASASVTVSGFMVLLGIGMGMSIPVMNVATQNAVPAADLGSATSTLMFVRTTGGALGVAAFSTLMLTRLRDGLATLPEATGLDVETLVSGPKQIQALEEPLRSGVITQLADAIAAGFWIGVVLLAVAAVISVTLPELPLREDAHVSLTDTG